MRDWDDEGDDYFGDGDGYVAPSDVGSGGGTSGTDSGSLDVEETPATAYIPPGSYSDTPAEFQPIDVQSDSTDATIPYVPAIDPIAYGGSYLPTATDSISVSASPTDDDLPLEQDFETDLIPLVSPVVTATDSVDVYADATNDTLDTGTLVSAAIIASTTPPVLTPPTLAPADRGIDLKPTVDQDTSAPNPWGGFQAAPNDGSSMNLASGSTNPVSGAILASVGSIGTDPVTANANANTMPNHTWAWILVVIVLYLVFRK